MKLRLITRSVSIAAVSVLLTTLLAPNAALAVGPTATALPTISGTLSVGQTLNATSGTWNPALTNAPSYQWYRCVSQNVATCSQISGATTSSYLLTNTDGANYLQVQVTALNAGGGTTVTSAFTGRVATQATTTTSPVISGSILVGSTLSLSSGTWSGVTVPAFVYKWQSCTTADATACTDIPSATANTFVITSSQVGKFIRGAVSVVATADNLAGISYSSLTAQISSDPILLTAPTIAGFLALDEVLTASAGTYAAFPAATFTYQWQSCTSTEVTSCAPIAGETNTTYSIKEADIGKYFRFMVTALNNLGGKVSPSAITTVALRTSIPANTGIPVLAGSAVDRQTLVASPGTWSGIPTGTITYQWQKCADAAATNCADIAGKTTNSYLLVFDDVAKFFRAKVTSTNRIGATSVFTATSAAVTPATVLDRDPFAIGFVQVGQKWDATDGNWRGAINPTYGYQWQRCVSIDKTSCVDIPNATAISYTLTNAEIGFFLRLKNWVIGQSLPAYSDIVPVKITAAPKTLVQTPSLNPKPAVTAKPVAKKITITCIKGKLTKKVTAVAPKCPAGYKKK